MSGDKSSAGQRMAGHTPTANSLPACGRRLMVALSGRTENLDKEGCSPRAPGPLPAPGPGIASPSTGPFPGLLFQCKYSLGQGELAAHGLGGSPAGGKAPERARRAAREAAEGSGLRHAPRPVAGTEPWEEARPQVGVP